MSSASPRTDSIKPASMGPRQMTANGLASAVAGNAKLGDKALDISRQLPCHEYVKALVAKKLRSDAVKFIAAWLPPRDSLWFATLGVWQVYRLAPGPGHRELIDRVVAYVTEPTQAAWAGFGPLRAAAKDSSPLGLLVQAAVLTGDNICPHPKKSIRPDPNLAGKTAANALIAAASRWPGKDRNACLDSFIELGLDIAEGKHLWGPNPGQKYPGLRSASQELMFGKTRNIWE